MWCTMRTPGPLALRSVRPRVSHAAASRLVAVARTRVALGPHVVARFAATPLLERTGSVATRAGAADGAAEAAAAGGEESVEEFMIREFYPWVKSPDDCQRCLEFLRSNEKLQFDLDKARVVMKQLRDSHYERYRERLPFALPKTWPGMQLVLQRCSRPLE